MRARPLIMAVAVAGCGGSTAHSTVETAPVHTSVSASPMPRRVLDLDCENTFGATPHFVGGRHSRLRPVAVGPITLARGTAIGGGRTARHTFVSKLPALVRPNTRIALEIDVGTGRDGGFFSITRNRGGGLVTAPPSAGQRRAYIGPCPRLPASRTAMGIFITTTRPMCATLTVRWAKQVRRTRVRLGVRHCSARAAPAARKRAPASIRVLDMDCQNTFAPGLPFLGGRHWRRKSVGIGAITVVRARQLGGSRTAPRTFVTKIPILLRPDVRASLDVDLDGRRVGGFIYPRGGGEVTAPPAQGTRRVYVGPCPRIPREADPVIPETGMGLFVTMTRPGCATLTVRWGDHRRKSRLYLGHRSNRRCTSRA
jgi:hypothetical protein